MSESTSTDPLEPPDSLVALRAAAARAAAEAALAKAAAAQAVAEAAQAALEAAELATSTAQPGETDTAPIATRAVTDPPPDAGAGAGARMGAGTGAGAGAGAGRDLDPWTATVSAGYSFTGPALPLGALMSAAGPVTSAQVGIPVAMLNRHGLVAGATGTGKTKTLQVLAEELSDAGVPVFVADLKGDLSGLCRPGVANEKVAARASSIGQDWQARGYPVEFLTLGGVGVGVPVRTTITDFGPLLLAKVLGLNATQESSLGLVFHWADARGLALLDLKDLQATIAHLLSDEGKAELKGIGGLSQATAGVILREIVALQAQGADVFFGEPAFDVTALLGTATDGRGTISALELPAVQDRPALFSTFLMWLLAELFSVLPEVGDAASPRLVFFFDEAHLLFTGASTDFLTQVTQTVRLIRSKGVGVFFVTQSPKDVPADVLAQLGSRVQHALRAYTPDDATALRAAARTFPVSDYDLEELLTTLATGEAVVTVLGENGAPTPVAWTRLRAPRSSMQPAPATDLTAAVAASPLLARYGTPIDRESAYELLSARAAQAEAAAAADDAARAAQAEADRQAKEMERVQRRMERSSSRPRSTTPGSAGSRRAADPLDAFLRSVGTQLGREITRTVFGTRRR